jgi:hypothetical protein
LIPDLGVCRRESCRHLEGVQRLPGTGLQLIRLPEARPRLAVAAVNLNRTQRSALAVHELSCPPEDLRSACQSPHFLRRAHEHLIVLIHGTGVVTREPQRPCEAETNVDVVRIFLDQRLEC